MSDIALRTYVEQLDSLIERKQIDEVLAHCRHILGLYPKHVDTYRMLGKALLEKNRHTDAADIFQRVLSVAPDDFISHVGMAIVREDEANLAAAIWHMERAFEASPSNGAIQQELCRLYGRRDGVTPAKARLTRGALARMYSQGGMFLQAEAELRSALTDDPERIDLLTVLARVYWQSGQPAEAAQACASILQKLPYSLEANRTLAAIFREQGRGPEAEAYRQRLEALDPYEAFVEPGRNGASARRVDAGRVMVQRLEYVPGTDDSGSPDWLTSIGAKFEEQPTRPAEAAPDWLTGEMETPISPAEVPAAGELPDWLRDLQPQTPAAQPEEPASGTPDWLSNLGVVDAPLPSQPVNEDLPDWLRTATGPLSSEAVPDWMAPAFSEPGQPPAPAGEQTEGDDDLPGWLAGLTAAAAGTAAALTPTEPAPVTDAEAPDELAAWLAGAPAAQRDEALPEWMQTEAAVQPDSADVAAEADEPPGAEATLALAQLAPAEAAPDLPAGAAAEDVGDVPDWLAALAPVEAEAPTETTGLTAATASEARLAEPTAMEAGTEWLADSAPAEAEMAAADTPHGDEPATDDTATDWLAALTPTATSEQAELAPADIPDWLKAAAPQGTLDTAGDVPDWLKAASDAGTAELPDWMRAGAAPEAEPTLEASAQLPDEVVAPTAPEAALPAPPELLEAHLMEQPGATPDEAPEQADSRQDWMGEAAAEGAPATPLAVPDWLQAVAASAPWPDALDGGEDEDSAKPMPDLPDFLQPASAAAIARAERPFDFEAMDSDEEAYADEPDEPDLVLPADIPAWLQALAPILPDPVTAPASELEPPTVDEAPPLAAEGLELEAAAPSEAPDWLAELNAAGPSGALPAWMPEPEEQPSDKPVTGSLVLPASEADLAGEPALDLPPWAQAEAPGPTDTIASWLKSRETPDWLRPEAAEHAEQPGEAAAILPDQPAADLPTPPLETPTDLPPWAQAQSPGASDTIVSWLAAKDLPENAPEWLRTPEAETPTAEMPAAEAAPEPAAMAAPAVPPEAEAGTFDDDEALRWLEGLAAQQGARPEELITAPEDRPSETPAWIAAQQADVSTLQEAAYAAPVAEEVEESAALAEAELRPMAMEADAAEPALAEAAGMPVAMEAETLSAESETASAPALADWLGQMEQAMPPDQLADTAPRKQPLWTIEAPTLEAQPATEMAAPAEAADEAAPALGEMDGEEALRWLEGLAARQGASPDELITAPEDRPAETPAWIAAMETAEPPMAEAVVGGGEAPMEAVEPSLAEPAAVDEAVEIDLASLATLAALVPGEPEGALPPAEEATPAMEPVTELEADDEALRWLEGLATRQGADPEALLTTPEERVTDTPAWIAAEAAARDELAAEPPPLAEPEPATAFAAPEWLPGEEPLAAPADQAPPEPAPAKRPQTGDLGRLSRLAERLAATRREREAEIEARFAEQRAEQEAARRLVQERMEAKRIEAEAPTSATGPLPAQPAAPPPAPEPAVMPDLTATVTHYAAWIDTGEHVDQAIRELEALVNQPAPAAPLLRVLGDAYTRQERLGEALEAYRMALARL